MFEKDDVLQFQPKVLNLMFEKDDVLLLLRQIFWRNTYKFMNWNVVSTVFR